MELELQDLRRGSEILHAADIICTCDHNKLSRQKCSGRGNMFKSLRYKTMFYTIFASVYVKPEYTARNGMRAKQRKKKNRKNCKNVSSTVNIL